MRGDDRGNCLSPARPLKGAGWRETVFGEFFGRIGDFRRLGAALGAGLAAWGCGRGGESVTTEDRRARPDRIWTRRAGMGTPGKGRQACGSSVHDMITKGKGRGWRFGVREARSGGRLSGCPGRGVGGQVSAFGGRCVQFSAKCVQFSGRCVQFSAKCVRFSANVSSFDAVFSPTRGGIQFGGSWNALTGRAHRRPREAGHCAVGSLGLVRLPERGTRLPFAASPHCTRRLKRCWSPRPSLALSGEPFGDRFMC